jgi:hypothetical protein
MAASGATVLPQSRRWTADRVLCRDDEPGAKRREALALDGCEPGRQGTDPKGLLRQTPVVRELAALRYSDGSPVHQDRNLTGAEIMRDILVDLGKMDDVALQELGYGEWTIRSGLKSLGLELLTLKRA